MEFSRLNERQLDALREVSNVGMGNAATALSQLTGKTIQLNVPRAAVLETARMAEFLGGAERVAVGIYLRMLGNARGNILMIFPRQNAAKILEALVPRNTGGGETLTELELSALKEVGNILASAYLNALGEMLRMPLIPSVPCLTIDTVGTVIDHALADFGEVGGTTLVLDTEFFSAGERVNSEFFLLPAPSSLETILTALGIGMQ
ncbi:MAG TPA: chemotaxis protein CheC [Geobacteraceae bacterium]